MSKTAQQRLDDALDGIGQLQNGGRGLLLKEAIGAWLAAKDAMTRDAVSNAIALGGTTVFSSAAEVQRRNYVRAVLLTLRTIGGFSGHPFSSRRHACWG